MASFGVEVLTASEVELLSADRALARRFHVVSTREDSGVSFCRELWGLDANHVLDPGDALWR